MYRILVVDDEKNVADGVAYTLEAGLGEEAEIFVCYGAQGAKEYAAENLVDLIVCDIDMPRQSGLSLCRELLEKYPELKVVFLTGYSDFSYTYEALKLPDVSYVLKLENDEVLVEEVKKKLLKAESERRRKTELSEEKFKNQRLQREIGGLKLEKAVFSENNHDYDERTFLLIRCFRKEESVERLCMQTFDSCGEECRLTFAAGDYLAAIPTTEADGIVAEKAKRLQQRLFDEAGLYSTFVFGKAGKEDAGTRFRKLVRAADGCDGAGDALYFLREENVVANSGKDKEEDFAIRRVEEYVGTHLNADLSLNALAELVHYNPAYLSRRFKQVAGRNLSAYILDKRLTLAEKLLKETDLFIKDVAIRCGFTNPTQFGIAFLKKTGLAPNVYRRKNGRE